jgi:SAM-dependent methyltransferase
MDALTEREQNEIGRSAAEARDIILQPVACDRYLNPPSDTPYSLEYAFNLLGDVQGKTVLDLGCGSGANTIALFRRGAQVIGIDISPELIDLAKRRTHEEGLVADLRVGSAYSTGLPDHSVDVIFCIALVHHLEIPRVQGEMLRILREDGYVILQEPIRFSKMYGRLRNLLPAQNNVSDYEHPLTIEEFEALTKRYFHSTDTRFFRLPFVALYSHLSLRVPTLIVRASNWMINTVPLASRYATTAVTKLVPRPTPLRTLDARSLRVAS